MKPLNYLRPEGKAIFKEILKAIPKEVLKEIDTYELSMLSNAFDLHQRAALAMNTGEHGFMHKGKTGYTQVAAEFTAWQKTGDFINKHSHNFGLNPKSRENIKEKIFNKKEVKEETALKKLRRS